MPKDENSVVKSFRTTEEQFNEANEIFKKEGFSFSEVIRLLLEATINEGRIPRGLSTKTMEKDLDAAKIREDYIDSLLDFALPRKGENAKEKLLISIFGEPEISKNMTNKQLRNWADKWGIPENLSASTLADLHDCGFFRSDPWDGDYDFEIDDPNLDEETMVVLKFKENIKDNLEQIKRKMQIKAIKTLMEYGIEKDNSNNEEDEEEEV